MTLDIPGNFKIALCSLFLLISKTAFVQTECRSRLLTTSRGIHDTIHDTLRIKGIRQRVFANEIRVKTAYGKEIDFPRDTVWGYEKCGEFYRNYKEEFYHLKRIGSLILYSKMHYSKYKEVPDYFFSKTLNDKIYPLKLRKFKKQFKNNPCFIEKIRKNFKWYESFYEWDSAKQEYRIILLYDECSK